MSLAVANVATLVIRQHTLLPGDEQAATSIDPELDPTSDRAAKEGGTDLEDIYRFPFPIDPELDSHTVRLIPFSISYLNTNRGSLVPPQPSI